MNTEKESSLFYCFNGSGLNNCLLIDSEKAARVHTRRASAVNHLCFHYLVPNCEMLDYQVIDCTI